MENRDRLIGHIRSHLNQKNDAGNPVLMETLRNTYQYGLDLGFQSEHDFLSFIENKRILEVGSGKGGLAKSAAIRGSNARIVSLNPRLANRDYRASEKKATSTAVLGILKNWPTDNTPVEEFAQTGHDTLAVAGYAQFMPFTNNTFDAVIDSFAILRYENVPYSFLETFREMWRVTKEGGEILMTLHPFITKNKESVLQDFVEELFNDLQVPYEYRKRKYQHTTPANTAIRIPKNIDLDDHKIEELEQTYFEQFKKERF